MTAARLSYGKCNREMADFNQKFDSADPNSVSKSYTDEELSSALTQGNYTTKRIRCLYEGDDLCRRWDCRFSHSERVRTIALQVFPIKSIEEFNRVFDPSAKGPLPTVMPVQINDCWMWKIDPEIVKVLKRGLFDLKFKMQFCNSILANRKCQTKDCAYAHQPRVQWAAVNLLSGLKSDGKALR